MEIELAHWAAVFAWILSLYGVCRAATAAVAIDQPLVCHQRAISLSALLLTVALVVLGGAYWQSDFTVLNVAENSHTLKPWLYKLTGVWGNHEGSVLFWSWILAVYAWLTTRLPNTLNAAEKNIWYGVQWAVLAAFLTFVLWASNPFIRIFPPPTEGNDLNPLLQDPGLAFHPPLLYLGYVGTAVLFGLAITALVYPQRLLALFDAMRPWALLVWGFLTAGIALGSYWAYYELGWGGWWFWDPVENASLLPWLLLTALVHCLLLRDGLRHWVVLLAIGSFGLSLIGTFLVRSGILTSVHAFANDPTRGMYLLLILALLLGLALILYARRALQLGGGQPYGLWSKEMGIVWHAIILSVLCATVFLGTLYPLFLELAGGPKISIGAPYFNATFVPLSLPLLLVMALAGSLPMTGGAQKLKRRTIGMLIIMAVLLGSMLWAWLALKNLWPWLLVVTIAWLFVGTVHSFWRARQRQARLSARQWGMHLSHAAFAISLLGMLATSLGTSDTTVALRVGKTQTIAGYDVELVGLRHGQRDNYQFVQAELRVRDAAGNVRQLGPEKRHYASQNTNTTEVARWVRWHGDVYTALAEIGPAADQAVLRLAFKPLVSWIWLGAVMMAVLALGQAWRLWREPRVSTALPAPPSRLSWQWGVLLLLCSMAVYAVLGAPVFIAAQIAVWLG